MARPGWWLFFEDFGEPAAAMQRISG